MLEEEIKSPYNEENPFDYDKYRDETTVRAVADIFKILGKHADILAYKSDATKESVQDVENLVSQDIVKAIIEHKVPEGDMDVLIQTFQVVLHRLFDSIARLKKEYERELLARVLETRNPADSHYSREYATMADLYIGLEKIRIAQKDDPHQYFYSDKPKDR
jgi:hypothetical protein